MKTSSIPPSQYPACQTTASMIAAYLAGDFPAYERHKAILVSYISNLDEMIKSVRHAD